MFVRLRIAPLLLLLPTSALAHWLKCIARLIGNAQAEVGIGRRANLLRDNRRVGDALRRGAFKVLDPFPKFSALGIRRIDAPAREIVSA
jgi:hypothetical protein